jgi:outer membrane receptor protein involved in Fe transport
MDKTFTRSISFGDNEFFTANILGIDAVHQGLELEASFKPLKGLDINIMGSLNDWRWTNNVENIEVYNDDNDLIANVSAYIKDVHVGDAAQKTAAFNASYDFGNGIKLGMDYNFFGDVYAAFDPLERNAPNADGTVSDSWKLPDYHTVDLNLRYKFDFGPFKATMLGKVNNLLDTKYISDATDGSDHTWQSAYVYYGLGRTWSTSLIVNF